MTSIVVAEHAGACYGVERALHMVDACIQEGRGPIHTLGPLIHNPGVVADLQARGVGVVDDVADAQIPSTLVIRSHGVVPQVERDARDRGLDVVDATCPHVKRAHRAAEELSEAGYQVVVVGERGHPEVEGILARAGQDALVAGCADDLAQARLARRVGVVVQTTQSNARFVECVCALAPRVGELRVMNTVCAATAQRQQAAAQLAVTVDVMVVVGGRNSGNTCRLAEVCTAAGTPTYHVETPDDVDPAWFAEVGTVGVTAGASTPAVQIDAVVHAIRTSCDAADGSGGFDGD